MRARTPRHVLQELAERAAEWRFFWSGGCHIGDLLDRLPPEDRELIKQLKSDDITDVRPDLIEIAANSSKIRPRYSPRRKDG